MLLLRKIQRSFDAALSAWKRDDSSGALIEFELNVGIGLLPLFEPTPSGDLLERIGSFRTELFIRENKTFPLVRIRDDPKLCDECFVIKVRGTQVVSSHVALSRKLAVDGSFRDNYLDGIGVLEPVTGLPGIWVEEARWEEMVTNGFKLMTPVEVLLAHIMAVTQRQGLDAL